MHQRGLLHLQQGAAAEALPLLTTVAEARPDAGIWNDLGTSLSVLGRVDEAVVRLQGALALQPDCWPAYANLGKVLLEHGRAADAVPLLRRAMALNAEFTPIHVQLANALLELGNQHLANDEAPQAEHCYRDAMQLRADFAEAATNLGTALTAQNRLHEGIAAYRGALALRPGHADTEFALSLALLLNGEFSEGWRRFEARRETTTMVANYQRRLDVPRCRPQDLLSLPAGRTVLLLAEQGLGDTIQYVRYAPTLVQRGLRVIVEAPPELHTLLGSMPGMTIIGPDDPTPDCNAACFLLSLPLAFATDLASIPAAVPYLHTSAQRSDARRIGLVVSGDPAHPHDRHRSIPLSRLTPLLTTPGFNFVIAQRDIREADRAVMQAHGIAAPPLHDFADTAALLSQLDLLITIDTSVAHLAGALGLPVWLMLRFSPDYRWLLGRADSPWYPTMRLYRQPKPGDWDSVIEAIRHDLR
jgi:Flp pilus assembly protein TadD